MSDDPDLFDWGDDHTHARSGDPDTSHEAVPANLTQQAKRVLHAYRDGAYLLDEQAYERVGLEGHQRCSDLRQAGFIERTGQRGLTKFNKWGHRCRITKRGHDYLDGILLLPVDGQPGHCEEDVWGEVSFLDT